MKDLTPLQKCIYIIGTQTMLANKIGARQQHVSRWLRGSKVPAHYVIPIEKAVEGKVTRHELRPDLYPLED